jgi:hypothetical protein
MDHELLDHFSLIEERISNIDERFNKIDERFNQTCKKIDDYAGINNKKIEKKDYQFISAIIGSPLAVLIFTWLTTIK